MNRAAHDPATAGDPAHEPAREGAFGGAVRSGHSHGPRPGTAAAEHLRPLTIAFSLTASYMLVEVVGGLLSGSLALLSDAAHMATDALGLGLALAAIQLGRRVRASQHTYGTYRLEVLAAVVNGMLLFGVGGYVLVEAARRLADPPEVPGFAVAGIATVGFFVNLVSFLLLRAGAKSSLNVRGAFLEVLADMLGSLGVVLAGLVQATTGWPYADPIIAALIGLMVLPRTYQLMRQAVRILMEVAPPGCDVASAGARLAGLPGVVSVHDLHIWTVTDGIESATAHVVVAQDADWHGVLDHSRQVLEEEYGVTHATIQVEPHDHEEHPAAV
ncbi:MAG: cation diffusion facilitator family transporter [Mycobacteriales bacterium]